MIVLNAPDLDATYAVSAQVASLARPGDVIVLAGEMGAGKTAFARGFGAALGIREAITSPTFTLVHSYRIDDDRSLHHADLYRLDSTSEIEDLALNELAEFGGIVLVEWGDVAEGFLGPVLEIRLDPPAPDRVADDGVGVDDPCADEFGVDEFGVDEPRLITIRSVEGAWHNRWDRLAAATSGYSDQAFEGGVG